VGRSHLVKTVVGRSHLVPPIHRTTVLMKSKSKSKSSRTIAFRGVSVHPTPSSCSQESPTSSSQCSQESPGPFKNLFDRDTDWPVCPLMQVDSEEYIICWLKSIRTTWNTCGTFWNLAGTSSWCGRNAKSFCRNLLEPAWHARSFEHLVHAKHNPRESVRSLLALCRNLHLAWAKHTGTYSEPTGTCSEPVPF
jgi:hypothetical protein